MTTETRARAPRKDAAENREALIMAAATLLNRDPSASLEAIATEAGLSRRAVYGHFETRDALLREVAVHGAARINAAVLSRSPEAEPRDPALHLATVGARIWHEVDHIRVMALLTVRGPQVRLVGDTLKPLRDHVRGIVGRGVDEGAFRDDIPVDRLSRLVESAAISALDEATRSALPSTEGRRLVVLSVLSIAGFSSREAAAILLELDSSTAPEETR